MTDSNIPEIPQPPAPSERSKNADDRQVIQPYVDPEVLAEDVRAAERRKHRRRMSHEHIRRIKRKKRIRMVLIVIGALLLIIAALAAWLGLSALKAKNEVEAAIQAASRIQSQVQAGDTDKAQASIEAFSQHIDATYAQTKQPVWKLATLVPYYGSDVKAARDMVHILEDVSNNALPKLAKAAQALDFNSIGIKFSYEINFIGSKETTKVSAFGITFTFVGCCDQRRHGQDWRYAYSADYRGGAAGA